MGSIVMAENGGAVMRYPKKYCFFSATGLNLAMLYEQMRRV